MPCALDSGRVSVHAAGVRGSGLKQKCDCYGLESTWPSCFLGWGYRVWGWGVGVQGSRGRNRWESMLRVWVLGSGGWGSEFRVDE